MSDERIVRRTLWLLMIGAVLCMSSASSATISFTNNTLTYSSPSDLGTTIDPAGLYDVQQSFGTTKADFQALSPQVVAFNGAPAPGTPLNALAVNYSTTGTVTFTFAVSYNYGSYTSYGRGGYSGSSYQDAISTAPNTVGGVTDWLDAAITTTGGQGVRALGFCAAFRNDQAVPAGQILFTLSDATTETITLPALGGAGNPEYVFIGYQAPAGKTITRVQASRTSTVGGAWVSIDDLSFVMSSDTTAPAAVTNLTAGSATSSSLTLSWTAPGDDGSTGTATSYDIRYRTGGAVNDGNWASATQVTGEPAPAAAGTNQNMVVSGLSAGTTYYFAIKASDEVPNTSAISNSPSGTTSSGGGSGTGLQGEYFNNMDFTSLALTRTDATVDFDWSIYSPDASVGADTFSVRWTGQVQAQYNETYTFYTVSDDGVRLWVNGQQIINNWTDHGPTENSGTITLAAGQRYDITMEFYENGGGATARLLWSSPSTTKQAVPQAQLYPPASSGTGLRGEYFNNMDFTSLVLTRTDATVDFDWGTGSPDPAVGVDTFSVRWTGQVQAQYSETYTFYTYSDDGVRLWVNGLQLINNWTDHAPFENSGTIALLAGQKYSITMEYYENGVGAVARLLWSSASTPKAVIPQAQLYPATGGGDTTAPAAVTNLATSNPTSGSLTLSWTAPGDDGSTGTAASYDIRYSTAAINDSNWASATQVTGEPAPAAAGTNQNMVVSGLSASTTYYFAIKTADEVPNTSLISNSPSGTTSAATTDASIPIATGYDDAWENGSDGWVQHCKNLRSAWVGKSDGFVLHIGDSITYANPYGSWARYGSGKTTADTTICSWMHSDVWGGGTNTSVNGWYLAAWDVSGRNGSFTAKSGIRADQYIAGNYSLPSADQMFTPGFTNPDGKQYRDAQICVLMLGTNDAGAGRTAAAVAADLDTIVRWLEAADVIVAISTLPPRNGMDSTIQAYNTEIRALAQRKRIPLIDYYQEIVRRRPGGSWMNTLISSDGVHPSADYGGSTASSDPYANSGAALSNSGYLLRDWLSVQKINEIKTKVYTAATTWNVSSASALQNAVANYAAGDTIVVAAGTYYPTGRLYFNRGGVTIRGATGNRNDVVISGPGMTVYAEPVEMMDVSVDDVTIKDLTIQNVYHHGVHMRGENDADRTRIQNVRTLNCGERHLKGSYNSGTPQYVMDDHLIENCLLEQTQPNSNHPDNDYIAGLDTMGVKNLVMRDCVVKGIVGPTGGGRAGIFIWHTDTNPTIERNQIYGCDRGIAMGNPGWAGPGAASNGGILRNNMITRGVNIALELCFTDDMRVYNNTIYSADAGYFRTIHIFDSSGIDLINGLDLRYNIIRGQIYDNAAGTFTETGDITGSTPATTWFADPANGNLHLTASATPAFNVGAPLSDVPTDFDKQTRSSTPDVGADEY